MLAGNSDLWNDGNLDNNSEFGTSGFNGLPAGYRKYSGSYIGMGNYGYFWSSSESNFGSAWHRILYYNGSHVSRSGDNPNNNKQLGFSIRCLKD